MKLSVQQEQTVSLLKRSDAYSDMALTLPIFLMYHLGVVFLPVRNAADLLTTQLIKLANHSMLFYALVTLGIGSAIFIFMVMSGKESVFDWNRFALIGAEGALYAVLMRVVAGYAIGALPLGLFDKARGAFAGIVMSLGAGFYEEIVFRVGLFGLGQLLIQSLYGRTLKTVALSLAWAMLASGAFAGWHYVGPLADLVDLRSFVFRMVCAMVLTCIYFFRGFAPAVWTHALYDVWVTLAP